MQIVKKVDVETARGKKKRNPLNDLRREVAIMRTLRHKNIVSLQVCRDGIAWAPCDALMGRQFLITILQ